MMKRLIVSLVTLFSPTLWAMPCDWQLQCVSSSGKYAINLRTCPYNGSLTLNNLTIGDKVITTATLGANYDSTDPNGQLAFNIDMPLPNQDKSDTSRRIISVEIADKSKAGVMKQKFMESDPGQFKVIAEETISCRLTG